MSEIRKKKITSGKIISETNPVMTPPLLSSFNYLPYSAYPRFSILISWLNTWTCLRLLGTSLFISHLFFIFILQLYLPLPTCSFSILTFRLLCFRKNKWHRSWLPPFAHQDFWKFDFLPCFMIKDCSTHSIWQMISKKI